MQLLDTVVLGVVEGLTEFLPISSTGHMILASHLLGQQGEIVEAFEVFIQLGAILAVVMLYHKRFEKLFDFESKTGFTGSQGMKLLALTTIPALVVGVLLEHYIKDHLFNPVTVTWALGIGGVAIILVERFTFKHDTKTLDQLTIPQALMIGCFQCLALFPGTSRAAATIIGGMVAGLDRKLAAEYSFLAAVPIMVVVSLHDLLKVFHELTPQDLTMYAIGFAVAFVSAVVAVKGFIQLLQKMTLAPFGVYRIILAVAFYMLVLR